MSFQATLSTQGHMCAHVPEFRTGIEGMLRDEHYTTILVDSKTRVSRGCNVEFVKKWYYPHVKRVFPV